MLKAWDRRSSSRLTIVTGITIVSSVTNVRRLSSDVASSCLNPMSCVQIADAASPVRQHGDMLGYLPASCCACDGILFLACRLTLLHFAAAKTLLFSKKTSTSAWISWYIWLRTQILVGYFKLVQGYHFLWRRSED